MTCHQVLKDPSSTRSNMFQNVDTMPIADVQRMLSEEEIKRIDDESPADKPEAMRSAYKNVYQISYAPTHAKKKIAGRIIRPFLVLGSGICACAVPYRRDFKLKKHASASILFWVGDNIVCFYFIRDIVFTSSSTHMTLCARRQILGTLRRPHAELLLP